MDEYFIAKAEGEAASAAYWEEHGEKGSGKIAREIGFQARRATLVRLGKLSPEPAPPEQKWTKEEEQWAKETPIYHPR